MEDMKEKDKIVDVDRAWKALHIRLQNDDLLTTRDPWLARKRRYMQLAALFLGILVVSGATFLCWDHKEAFKSSFIPEIAGENMTLVSTLADGSTVYLADGGTLTCPGAFEENRREISMTGDALFEVVSNPRCPFIIETPNVVVEVTGTVFNVRSFPSREDFELYVQEGTVEVVCKANEARMTVQAGELVRLQAGEWQKGKASGIDLYALYTAKMRFKDESLSAMLPVLNRIGDRPIVLCDPEIGRRKMTVAFSDNDSEVMAQLICTALNLRQTIKQDTIYISKP